MKTPFWLDILEASDEQKKAIESFILRFYETFPELQQWNIIPERVALIVDKTLEEDKELKGFYTDRHHNTQFDPYRKYLRDRGYEAPRSTSGYIVLDRGVVDDDKSLCRVLTEELLHHHFSVGAFITYHHWAHLCAIFLACNYLRPKTITRGESLAERIPPEQEHKLRGGLQRAEQILRGNSCKAVVFEILEHAKAAEEMIWGKGKHLTL
ncbi:MAG: hypothetical protein V3U52_08970 [Thermoplasmata archaeon]